MTRYEGLERRENTDSGNRFVTVKTLIGILLVIVFAATSLIITDTRSGVTAGQIKLERLQVEKLDKDSYYRDMADIKVFLKDINGKIDTLTEKARRG